MSCDSIAGGLCDDALNVAGERGCGVLPLVGGDEALVWSLSVMVVLIKLPRKWGVRGYSVGVQRREQAGWGSQVRLRLKMRGVPRLSPLLEGGGATVLTDPCGRAAPLHRQVISCSRPGTGPGDTGREPRRGGAGHLRAAAGCARKCCPEERAGDKRPPHHGTEAREETTQNFQEAEGPRPIRKRLHALRLQPVRLQGFCW